ncbi:MAG: zinc-binding dehydrogenase [bacterium]
MRAMEVSRFGGPEVFRMTEGLDPEPGPGEVTVRVEAAGINFADILARMGLYPDAGDPPFVTGYEFAGRVESVGEGVGEREEGQLVVGMRDFGCYADRVKVPAGLTFPLEEGSDPVRAAAIPVAYLTAWHALVYMGNLHGGERVLIHNAGGAVGSAAVQIARHRGAEILGTSSPGKHDWLRELGVDHPIDYRTGGWTDRVREITGGEGVEMILDPMGGAYVKEGFELLAPTGRLVCYGVSSFAPGKEKSWLKAVWEVFRAPRFNSLRLMTKNRGVFGVHLGHLWKKAEMLRSEFERILEGVEEGYLDPAVDATFPLENAASAHHYIQDRKNRGKVVLTIS